MLRHGASNPQPLGAKGLSVSRSAHWPLVDQATVYHSTYTRLPPTLCPPAKARFLASFSVMALQLLACSLFVLLATAQVFTIPIHPNINAVERRLARRDLGASRTYAQILDERAGRPTQFQLTSNDNIEPVSHRVEITVGNTTLTRTEMRLILQ